jgi:hypothetical protein
MSEIKCTTDYFIFKKHESNRNLDQANINRLKASMQAKNLMMFKPILVDKHMRVLDGQHRLEAAKCLGIEVYYQIDKESDAEEIILINANQKRWGKEDYLNYFISKGNENYLKVQEFCKKHMITLAEFLRIDPIRFNKQGFKQDVFVMGTYKFPELEKFQRLNCTMDNLSKINQKLESFLLREKKFTKSAMFKRALIEFINREDVIMDVFLNKLTYKIEALHGCADSISYINMFKDIYNWRNQNPVEF